MLSAAGVTGVAESNGALGRDEMQETPGAPEAAAPSEGSLGGAGGIEGARGEVADCVGVVWAERGRFLVSRH